MPADLHCCGDTPTALWRRPPASAADLLIRRLPSALDVGKPVAWFENSADRSPRHDDIEVDLLEGYELSGCTDFWMEPGEVNHAGSAVVLEPGLYVAMVTFIGPAKGDFWRRIFVVDVAAGSK